MANSQLAELRQQHQDVAQTQKESRKEKRHVRLHLSDDNVDIIRDTSSATSILIDSASCSSGSASRNESRAEYEQSENSESELVKAAKEQLRLRKKTIVNTFRITSITPSGKSTPSILRKKSSVLLNARAVIQKRADELHRTANDYFEKEECTKAISYFNKAIVLNPDDVDYYTGRGESYLQLCDFQSAILNYRKACILEPEHEPYFSRLSYLYFLQGQCFFDEKKYQKALECFSRAAEIKPDDLGFHTRSIACLAALQRHGECLALVNKRLDVEKDNPDLFVMRARLHDLFRNAALCYYDLKDALDLDSNHTEAKKMLEEIKLKAQTFKNQAERYDLTGKPKDAIVKISAAIETDPSVPDFHVYRAALHRRGFDFNSAVDDLLVVMDKTDHDETHPIYKEAQKQLLLNYNDFAVECFSKGFYEEAIVLLNKAIKSEKVEKRLYTNRGGQVPHIKKQIKSQLTKILSIPKKTVAMEAQKIQDCFYKTHELHFSLSDYLQALELDPKDKSITIRLSVVYNDLGILEYQERRYQQAEEFFSVAINYNPSASSYYVSRARARYMLEDLDSAQVDAISALHLQKDNKEVVTIFARLFPGKSTGDIIQTPFSIMIGEALQSVIGEIKDNSSTVKDNESASFQSLNRNEVLPDICTSILKHRNPAVPNLKSCMKEKDFHVNIIKGKRKVNDLVESVIQARQDLHYTGPRVNSKSTGSTKKLTWINKDTNKVIANSRKNGEIKANGNISIKNPKQQSLKPQAYLSAS